MAYAVKQDIIDRYGEDAFYSAFDWDGIDDVDDTVVDTALEGASDEIDGYLAGRYTLPLQTIPRILILQCVDIALYRGSGVSGASQTEEKKERYDDAIKYLLKVAEGKISLGIEKPSQGGSGGSAFSSNDRLFTRETMKGIL
ncbi:conserved hypothetical protein [uncultured Desulfobacterium sp.]|uniref:DUF1320 domain-containing protein n=1 Tax=uncultured Desulfobacterium sp. TaxID=201089 RepID=A0A445MWT9_9BACT|nr:conserved hypothetical protein [uncultured Desulfobacterium sp.]